MALTQREQMVVRAYREAARFPAVGRRRYVAIGIPGGYRVWDNKARRWWGELYQLCPDRLLDELNGTANPEKITDLLRFYRTQKR
jgi:hypothetical protein